MKEVRRDKRGVPKPTERQLDQARRYAVDLISKGKSKVDCTPLALACALVAEHVQVEQLQAAAATGVLVHPRVLVHMTLALMRVLSALPDDQARAELLLQLSQGEVDAEQLRDMDKQPDTSKPTTH